MSTELISTIIKVAPESAEVLSTLLSTKKKFNTQELTLILIAALFHNVNINQHLINDTYTRVQELQKIIVERI